MASASGSFEEQLERVVEAGYGNGVDAGAVTSGVKMTPRGMRAVALHVAGFQNYEIAEIVGMGPEWVSHLINSPEGVVIKQRLGDQMVKETVLDARQMVAGYAGEAVMNIVGLARGAKSEVVRLRANQDVLDRGGVPKNVLVSQTNLLLKSEDVNSIREALAAMNEKVPVFGDVVESHKELGRSVGAVTAGSSANPGN